MPHLFGKFPDPHIQFHPFDLQLLQFNIPCHLFKLQFPLCNIDACKQDCQLSCLIAETFNHAVGQRAVHLSTFHCVSNPQETHGVRCGVWPAMGGGSVNPTAMAEECPTAMAEECPTAMAEECLGLLSGLGGCAGDGGAWDLAIGSG
jgi:hypothetical protein